MKVSNDGPTLVGANASFSIALHFPESQKVLPDGQVVWANNTIINGEYLSTPGPYSKGSDSLVSQVSSRSAPFPSTFFSNKLYTYSVIVIVEKKLKTEKEKKYSMQNRGQKAQWP